MRTVYVKTMEEAQAEKQRMKASSVNGMNVYKIVNARHGGFAVIEMDAELWVDMMMAGLPLPPMFMQEAAHYETAK